MDKHISILLPKSHDSIFKPCSTVLVVTNFPVVKECNDVGAIADDNMILQSIQSASLLIIRVHVLLNLKPIIRSHQVFIIVFLIFLSVFTVHCIEAG